MRVINTAVALTYKKKLIEIYGDLALLTSKYNVPKQRKKKRLCIIPHYVDFENEVIQEYKEIFQDEIEICTLSNKIAQLELNLSFLLELSIKKYICTMTTKKNLSEGSQQRTSESLLKDIRRNTKRIFTSEQKVLIVMEGIRGEQSIAELCRKYGISDSTYYKWNKEFIEAGKARLDGDIVREATSDEVKVLRQENIRLKEALADLVVRYDVVKKA